MKAVTATDRPSSCPTSLAPGWFRSAHHQTPLCAFENETVSKLLHHEEEKDEQIVITSFLVFGITLSVVELRKTVSWGT